MRKVTPSTYFPDFFPIIFSIQCFVEKFHGCGQSWTAEKEEKMGNFLSQIFFLSSSAEKYSRGISINGRENFFEILPQFKRDFQYAFVTVNIVCLCNKCLKRPFSFCQLEKLQSCKNENYGMLQGKSLFI